MVDGARTCPLPTRRQWQAAAPDPTPGPDRTSGRSAPAGQPRRVARASVLVGLAALTVAVPVTGFVGPSSTLAIPSRAVGGTGSGGVTWANQTGSTIEAAALDGPVAAASRTKVRTPLQTTTCVAADTAADGGRSVVATPVLYWPLTRGSYTVASGFSMRISPISGQLLMHEGVDLSAALGTPIHAAADGTVVEVSSNYRSGTVVKIKHTADDGSTFYTAYLHEYMDDILVTVGQQVKAGQRIGAVGSNGWSTGPHLHFEVHDASDTPIDPMPYMDSHGAVYVGQECQ